MREAEGEKNRDCNPLGDGDICYRFRLRELLHQLSRKPITFLGQNMLSLNKRPMSNSVINGTASIVRRFLITTVIRPVLIAFAADICVLLAAHRVRCRESVYHTLRYFAVLVADRRRRQRTPQVIEKSGGGSSPTLTGLQIEFPANREKNREFFYFSCISRFRPLISSMIPRTLTQIPCSRKQGIILAD
jgi:hypothetical protein